MLAREVTLTNRQVPTLEDVYLARSRFEGRVLETPFWLSHSFSHLTGREIWLKAECLQRAGSFKIRGALNMLTQIAPGPVVAASAGNHAQGVALAATFTNRHCTVFMPRGAAIPKIEATRDYGAEVELVGSNLEESVEAALAFSGETRARFVHPYDDPAIIAGQGTVGLELLEQLPRLGTVVVPTGGGGLLAGVALTVKAVRPEVKVVGVEIAAAPTYRESRKAGRPVPVPPSVSLADGINVSQPSELVFTMIEGLVDDLLVVDDDQTTSALTLLLERSKLMVEPAGAVAVAAALEGLIPGDAPEPIGLILSGGNIDLLLLGKVVRRGLETAGRYGDFQVRVPDQPGHLMRVLEAIAAEGGNVVDIEHHRHGSELAFGTVQIDISVETRGPDHTDRLRQILSSWVDG
jgi:threonine dehydratase